MIRRPFNLKAWIDENRDLLKPPVGNKNLYTEAGDYIVMIVGGPNARKDYHYNETEELFYQVEGDIEVGIQEDGKAVTIPIREGELFLLPAGVPHQPRRGADTVGLVIEVKRADREMKDGLLWFCEKCNHKLHETYFVLENIEKDFIPRFREFYGSEEMRTCTNCGHVMETDPRFVRAPFILSANHLSISFIAARCAILTSMLNPPNLSC
jgi:3-hydroxyanthranilate 3,4-dioxygenase